MHHDHFARVQQQHVREAKQFRCASASDPIYTRRVQPNVMYGPQACLLYILDILTLKALCVGIYLFLYVCVEGHIGTHSY